MNRRPAHRLVAQEPGLALEAAAVAGEIASGPDDPVAGHDDRHGVAAVGEPDRAAGLRVADPTGQFAIRDRRAVGDLEQARPHSALEVGADELEWHVELLELAREVGAELRRDVLEPPVVADPLR